MSPVHAWYSYPENIALIIAGLCISFFVFFVMQNNSRLEKMRSAFEIMAITDPLTGIFNRRHFFNVAQISNEKARRQKTNAFIVIFDIDRFKQVNDKYGHTIGDKVLLDITARVKAGIRPYDIFARYGGEEFIIYTSDITNDEVYEMAERLRLNLCNNQFEYEDVSFSLSASFGIAHIADYNIENTIKYADEALYTAKREGRNRVVVYR